MEDVRLRIGSPVVVLGKNLEGVVAFIGTTQFSSGKWVGVILNDPQGKNNGTVQGKRYFECQDNYGIFVRPTQVAIMGPDGPVSVMETSVSSIASESTPRRASGIPPKDDLAKSQIPSRMSTSQSNIVPPQGGRDLARRASSNVSAGPPDVTAAEHEPSRMKAPSQISRPSEVPKTSITKVLPQSTQSAPQAPTAALSENVSLPPTAPAIPPTQATSTASTEHMLVVENLRAEVKDLSEKLEVMQSKRAEDRAKLKEAEAVKMSLAQLEENQKQMQKKSADLQRQLAQAKSETAETKAAFERYQEEMTELSETIEMATLDKEMAEEKLEAINIELEGLKEKVEELTLENQILKEEQTKTPIPDAVGEENASAPTILQMKQLEQQNERMKMGLITFRNLASQDKEEISSLTKEVASLQSEVTHLSSEKNRLSDELSRALENIIELKEQVDAAVGVDQIVSALTEKNHELEEMIERLTEERNDLEALCDTNDELLEGQRDKELEIMEQLDVYRTQLIELARQLDANKETVADYEITLAKFRTLVTQLQTQNTHLNQSLVDVRRTASSGSLLGSSPVIGGGVNHAEASALMVVPGKNVEAQTVTRVIETELRKLAAEQGTRHVEWLSAFLPESFSRRAGDGDAIQLLLLIDRLIAKCELLATQVRKRFPLPVFVRELVTASGLPLFPADDVLQPPATPRQSRAEFSIAGDEIDETAVFRSQSELISFTSFLIMVLQYWRGLLLQFKTVLSSCSVELFAKLVTLYNDLSTGHEQILDKLLDLCRKDHLDETVSLEGLISSVTHFVNIHTVHIVPAIQSTASTVSMIDATEMMASFAQTVLSASEAITVDAACLAVFTGQPSDVLKPEASTSESSSVGLPRVIELLSTTAATLRARARRIRRGVPNETKSATAPLSFPPSLAACLDLALHKLLIATRCLFTTTRNTGQMVATQMAEETALDAAIVLRDCLSPAVKMILSEMDMPVASTSPTETQLTTLLDGIAAQVTSTSNAMEHGEYDFDGTMPVKPQEPIILRAASFIRSLAELESSRGRLELKEEQVRELQMALKARADEISEMTVRVSVAEKKLETAGKGSLEKIVKLEQRLQMATSEQKRTEKEYEQALDTIQNDIEKLEKENSDLREKLRTMSKQTLHEGLTRSALSTAMPVSPTCEHVQSGVNAPPVPGSASKLSAFRDASALVNEIEVLREAVRHLSSENSKLAGLKMKAQLSKLVPLCTPRRPPVISDDASQEASPDTNTEVAHATRTLYELSREVESAVWHSREVMATQRVVRLTSASGDVPVAQLARQSDRLLRAKKQLEKAHEGTLAYIKSRPDFSVVTADFATFASSLAVRKLIPHTAVDDRLLARIKLPRASSGIANRRVKVSAEELRNFISAII